jgi:hypothetical protein
MRNVGYHCLAGATGGVGLAFAILALRMHNPKEQLALFAITACFLAAQILLHRFIVRYPRIVEEARAQNVRAMSLGRMTASFYALGAIGFYCLGMLAVLLALVGNLLLS